MSKRLTICEAAMCNNNRRNCDLVFFNFPNNEERLKKWLENMELKESSRKFKYLCSSHFELATFTNSMRKRLLVEAVPTIHAPGVVKNIRHMCLPFLEKDNKNPVDKERENVSLNTTGNTDNTNNVLCSKHIDVEYNQHKGAFVSQDDIPKLFGEISENLSQENDKKSVPEKENQTSTGEESNYVKQNALLLTENVHLKRKLKKAEEETEKYKKIVYHMNRIIKRQEKILSLQFLVERLEDEQKNHISS